MASSYIYSKESSMRLLTYDPKKQKTVVAGYFTEKIFFKEVKNNHYMKLCKGYGINVDVIDQLKKLDCKLIVVFTPTNILMSMFIDWLKPNIRTLDFGYGKQKFLPDRYFKEPKPEHISKLSELHEKSKKM